MRWRLLLFTSGLALGLAACADVLGLDDGIPRPDASMDAAVEAAIDAAPDVTIDAGPDGPFSPLSCGQTTCNFALGEACCRTGTTTYQCVTSPSDCAGTYIPCDRPSQCAPDDAGPTVCCTTDVLDEAGTDWVAQSVACKPYNSCLGTPQHYILCGDGDAAADCPAEAGCAPSTSTIPPFLICK